MKTWAPLIIVLVAVPLWAWLQRAQAPLVVPTRANAAVHGVHLGDSESQVILGVGKPDQVQPILTKARPERAVWTWAKPLKPPQLRVTFEDGRVINVAGTSLTVGCKEYGLEAGRRDEAARWLGSPLSSEPVHLDSQLWTGTLTTWTFPQLRVQMLAREGAVTYLGIEENR